jgi:hypothetical protein
MYSHPSSSSRRGKLRKLLSVSLTLALLALTIPPAGARAVAQEAIAQTTVMANGVQLALLRFGGWFSAPQGTGSGNGMPPSPPLPPRIKPHGTPRKEEREARVDHIEINPDGDVTLSNGQSMHFVGIPLDIDGNAVHGLAVEWESSAANIVSISALGKASAIQPGIARLTASAGQKHASVNVAVTAVGAMTGASGSEKQAREGGSNAKGTVDRKIARSQGLNLEANSRRAPAGKALRPEPSEQELHAHAALPASLLLPNQLPANEVGSLYSPANSVGSPPGKTTPGASTKAAATSGTETPGAANFSFSLRLRICRAVA